MKVLVDADSCPVLDVVRQVCGRAGVPVVTVASYRHEIIGEGHITVGPEPEAADLAIINRTQRGDVVITRDYGLAALVLARGAHALNHWGHRFRNEEMDGRLAQRALNERLRRMGRHVRMPRRRKPERGIPFAVALRCLLQEVLKGELPLPRPLPQAK
ncbi:MAG TPA: DUF188 domain-containing protein [Symbiobacteriaceae bacterium]|jgi:uncharacterized protein YaiI (UPF0178 family)|nr:DUF188 domain-containing protein [Symbiobacteriaceae bacterium]